MFPHPTHISLRVNRYPFSFFPFFNEEFAQWDIWTPQKSTTPPKAGGTAGLGAGRQKMQDLWRQSTCWSPGVHLPTSCVTLLNDKTFLSFHFFHLWTGDNQREFILRLVRVKLLSPSLGWGMSMWSYAHVKCTKIRYLVCNKPTLPSLYTVTFPSACWERPE